MPTRHHCSKSVRQRIEHARQQRALEVHERTMVRDVMRANVGRRSHALSLESSALRGALRKNNQRRRVLRMQTLSNAQVLERVRETIRTLNGGSGNASKGE